MIRIEISGNRNISIGETDQILGYLQADGVIVYPTDTLYGLGADASSTMAVAELYRLKSRQAAPVSVLTRDVESLLEMTRDLSEQATRLVRTFLPGALTVICKSDYPFAPQLISARATVGFRVPGDGLSTMISALLGRPLTTTSVNPAGLPPAKNFKEVLAYYGEQIPLMIDKGPLQPSRGSTVIDVTTRPFRILREGEIPRQALEDFIN